MPRKKQFVASTFEIIIAIMAGHPSALCPHCGYPQRGLPLVHDCPECGFAFDGTQVIFINRRSRFQLLFPAIGAMLLLDAVVRYGLWTSPNVFTSSRSTVDLIVAGLLISSLVPAFALPRWRYVVVGLDDLTLVRGEQATRYGWSEISSAMAWPTLTVSLRIKRGGTLWLRGLFDKWADARAFASLARRRMRMHRIHTESQSA